MADEFVEIRHMLKTFRVAELQELLGYASRSKSGRKHQLLGRALDMLKCDPGVKVRNKIRELYGNRYPRRMYVPPYQTNSSYSSNASEQTRSGTTNMSSSSMQISATTQSASLPIHPDVKLRPLPFYDFKDVLVRPNTLVPQGKSRFQDSYILFHLSPQQVSMITKSRDTRPNSNNEYTVQVLLRFCLLETSCAQDDVYPHSACLKVNGKVCPLPGYIPPDSKGEHKKSGRPVDITSYCRLSPTIPNHIHITWVPDLVQRFVATVHLVCKVTSSCLVQRLKVRGRRNPDHSKALIKEKLTQDRDSEVAATSLRCSLLCPLGKTRMTLPCRSKNCTHLQCFDAALYLQMNERKSRWICPVCDQEARFENLIIDGLFMEIIEHSPQSNDIVFLEDGSWKCVTTTNEPPMKMVNTTVISTPQHYEKPKLAESKPAKGQVIDLTIDSSDEEEQENDQISPRIPVLAQRPPSTSRPNTIIQSNQHAPVFQQDMFPANALSDLAFDENFSYFGVPSTVSPFSIFSMEHRGMMGQNAAHAINLD